MPYRASCERVLSLSLILWACAPLASAADARAEEVAERFSKSLQPFLAKNCYGCHGTQKQSGDLNLEELHSVDLAQNHRETWRNVLTRLKNGEMPPKKQPRPDAEEQKRAVGWLGEELSRIDAAANPNPGRVTARRLNKTEYNNTVRDLLGVTTLPADDFPNDDSGYGFDNIGDVLSMSPMLMEKYLKAAEKISRTALFGVERLKSTATIHQPWYIDFDTGREVKREYDETGISMPYSSHTIHRFPVDGEYEITGWLRGFRPIGSDPIHVGFWIDGKMVHEAQIAVPANGELNGLWTSFKTQVGSGDHWLATTILKIYEGLPAAYGGPNPNQSTSRVSKSPTEFFTQNIRVVGPLSYATGPSAESLKKIYVCGHLDGKHEAGCAKQIVSDLARRAYRRPPTQEELDGLLNLIALAQKEGDTFEQGLSLAIQKMLISPHFLFRIERGMDPDVQSTGARPLSPYELASRLSYFIWSTLPDEELSHCADDGSLSKPEVLESQTRRMLKDPKSKALVENFGGQWLQFRGLESHTVERKKFQQLTDYTIMSMRQESELYFDHILREDRSILEFIDSNYTFLNQRLAEFYGIDGVKGHEFRKVELSPDSHRGGVITQASTLTVSSYATRTSPVIRGKWILENLLNTPPPPPPPDVPGLKEEQIGATMTMREQLTRHRENATCASCHARMDPLGFGLENFNAIGMWRTKDGQFDIDSSGELPDGRTFKGPAELKAILMSQKEAFADCIADKMLTYALGRGLTDSDRPAVGKIVAQLVKDDYRFSSLVLGIVNSAQFQMLGGAAIEEKTP